MADSQPDQPTDHEAGHRCKYIKHIAKIIAQTAYGINARIIMLHLDTDGRCEGVISDVKIEYQNLRINEMLQLLKLFLTLLKGTN